MRATAHRRRKKRRRLEAPPPAAAPPAAKAAQKQKNPLTDALGPQHRLGNVSAQGSGQKGPTGSDHGRTITLSGVTHHDFQSPTFSLADSALSHATDCDNCEDDACVSVTGPLTITYRVNLTVELPSPSDFPGLTECEAQNVQNAIDTVLAPHEDQHVAALSAYNGTETVTFTAKFCQGTDINPMVTDFVNAREAPRQTAAVTASRALDPFNFTFDPSEGCEDTSTDAPAEEPAPDTPTGPEEKPPEDAAPDHEPEETPDESPGQSPEEEPPEETPAPAPPAPDQEPQP